MLERCSTGVDGLDSILGGGFPRNRLYLVTGDPGVGKTTLALQFLRRGLQDGDGGLYITLSETDEELRAVAASHGWDLDGLSLVELSAIEDRLLPEAQTTLLHPSEVELSQTTDLIFAEVERSNAHRVVFDSLSELRLLAQNELRYRRQILVFKQFFAKRRCTVLMLDDRTSDSGNSQIESLAHGVINLELTRPEFGNERRRMSIGKLRGGKFRGGYHDYLIETGGLHVFPRLVAAEHRSESSQQLVASGVAELDALLGGGMHRGTSNLLIGPAGSGKSTIAMQYAMAAARRGELVAYYAFDENLGTLITRAKGIGFDIGTHLESGKLQLRQVDPAEMSPGEFTHQVCRAVESDNARVVVIDSLNGYLQAMPEERFLTTQLHEVLTYLSQRGVLTIMVLAQHGLFGRMETSIDLTYLTDTVVVVRFFEAMGTVKKAISVVKKRSGKHETAIRELNIDQQGVRVGKTLADFQGILSGTPLYRGPQEAMLEPR
ncbi:MAG TPA: ATPase domain-containing protein [Pirellulales bacterium]|jgi:circadian clock protein KaiC|nr:ATPase domain-containing protein [Pirellulales bacterium]